MAAICAVILSLAAIGAVSFRVVVWHQEVKNTPAGDPDPSFWDRGNVRIVIAAGLAILVSLVAAPFAASGTGWQVVLGVLMLVMALLVGGLAANWPSKSWGYRIDTLLWGVPTEFETDPAKDSRLDSTSPVYDPKMDSSNVSYNKDYFEANALVKKREKQYGLMAYLIVLGAVVLCVLLGAMASAFGSLGGSLGGNPVNPAQPPATEAPASPAPTSKPDPKPSKSTEPTTAPTTELDIKPGTLEDKSVDVTGVPCDTLKKWLPAVPPAKQISHTFGAQGVERCAGKGDWALWTGEAPGYVTPIRAYDDATYEYRSFSWNGQDVLVRYPK